jgi:hypothetical protein
VLQSGIGTKLGLFKSNGDKPILPGSAIAAKSWWGVVNPNNVTTTTPGNALLQKYMANLGVGGGSQFNTTLSSKIEQGENNLISVNKAANDLLALGVKVG